ncbi:hypothetical protein F7725_025431 [Dissostichus mawsoni]|uniref:Uncharacterized protein n=1 Tax=Dissostichus mawsoni TaxID=36200 RepID=A0A7J5XCB4_DISMA|nr:hypothetical protein F7725_025431 [Dissostichus mawsoni]
MCSVSTRTRNRQPWSDQAIGLHSFLRETDCMKSFCSWKTKRRRELRCSVTNLCTFSYCHYERHSPRWQELIIYIYVCMSVGVPFPNSLCEQAPAQRKRQKMKKNLDDAHWTEDSYSTYRKTDINSE